MRVALTAYNFNHSAVDEKPEVACKSLISWWTWGGSNSRPHGCKPCALPTELQAQLAARIIVPAKP